MCACVKAIEKARAAALRVAVLPHQRQRASRSAATPVANVTRTNAPGASRTRSRSAATGSSTAPVVPDSARPSSAIGLAVDRPRPRKRARSVSHSTAPPSRPSTPRTWNAQSGASSAAARPPAEQQAGALRVVLGLDEQLAERRMREIVLGACQHDLGVAGDLDLARPIAAVGDRQPPHLHVVFRRDGDLELRFEVAVAAPERRLVELEGGLVLVGLAAGSAGRSATRPRRTTDRAGR